MRRPPTKTSLLIGAALCAGVLLARPALETPAFAGDRAGAEKRPPAKASIRALLEPIRARHGVPALGAAVVQGADLRAIGVTGRRAIGADRKVTVEDLWHLGSCTKSMTATLVARLADQGRMAWDLTMAEAFPDLADSMHPAWKAVTLELLLGNRAGAPADLDADGLWGRLWKHEGTPTEARRMLTAAVLAKPPATTPGEAYGYSNAGFAIAGHAVETVTKTPWETLMRKELFEPLKMTACGFGAPGDAVLIDQPRGHRVRGGRVEAVPPGPGADNPVAIAPAGLVHCRLEDWARYISLHLLGEQRGGKKLAVSRAALRKLHAPLEGQAYALGWLTTKRGWGGGTVLTHSGSNTMWYAVAWLAPKRGFGVIVTCNQGGRKGANACDDAAGALIRWHLENETPK